MTPPEETELASCGPSTAGAELPQPRLELESRPVVACWQHATTGELTACNKKSKKKNPRPVRVSGVLCLKGREYHAPRGHHLLFPLSGVVCLGHCNIVV